jgi:hypothetical protein
MPVETELCSAEDRERIRLLKISLECCFERRRCCCGKKKRGGCGRKKKSSCE